MQNWELLVFYPWWCQTKIWRKKKHKMQERQHESMNKVLASKINIKSTTRPITNCFCFFNGGWHSFPLFQLLGELFFYSYEKASSYNCSHCVNLVTGKSVVFEKGTIIQIALYLCPDFRLLCVCFLDNFLKLNLVESWWCRNSKC